jgi:beta-lactamase regulating signal transducer with metallopeptidase domain
MSPDLGWIYLFNIIVNSVLSFYTSILFVAFLICFLRIRAPRIKALCCLMPFCKIGLDLFCYRFSNWALAFDINPLLAEIGTRTLSIQINPFAGIQLSMQDGHTFSLADVIALSAGPLWIQMIVITAIAGTIIAAALGLIRLVRDMIWASRIIQNAAAIHRPMLNPRLKSWVKAKNAKYFASSAIHSPCVIGKALLFPSNLLDTLTQREFEAIIAHEMAHLRWMDRTIRIICRFLSAVFWWIPTQWWHNHMNHLQERASDEIIHPLGISKFDLAEAIVKAARNTQTPCLESAISFMESRTSLKTRIQLILEEHRERSLGKRAVQYSLLALGLCSILFGKMWIF